MFFWIGIAVIFVCVLGGYTALGGNVMVLWQPFEYVIIVGAACGAYLIGSPKNVIKSTGQTLKTILRGSGFSKAEYLELLSVQYALFKLANRQGVLALEQHVEDPAQSELFALFPHFKNQTAALEFMCDYLRLMTLGSEDSHQIEDLMDQELEVKQQEQRSHINALRTMADALPALGIVAAVLGIIKTMAAINQPPAVLGHSIGGALVGTFVGVFLSYGFVGPMASSLSSAADDELEYYNCIKSGLIAYLNGYAPAICVEFARKSIQLTVRPNFYEVENTVASVPNLN